MDTLTLKAAAKINLGLDVLRKREDGYHDLRMIMQSLKIHDRITLRRVPEKGIFGSTNKDDLPMDDHNLVYRAAKLLMDEFGCEGGVEITLEKKIPMAAGLAGGSSDAAAVLIGVNRLFGLNLTDEELMDRGVKLGADIPYCIMRGTALAEGIGEKLTRLPAAADCYVLLAKPAISVSTGFVYGNLRAAQLKEHPDIDGQIEAICQGDSLRTAQLMGNVLETVTVPAYPVIRELMDMMTACGADGSRMSGSGPTVFGLFRDKALAEKAYRMIQESGKAPELYLTGFYEPSDASDWLEE